jgi:hypothetical protein
MLKILQLHLESGSSSSRSYRRQSSVNLDLPIFLWSVYFEGEKVRRKKIAEIDT